jgi:hypothetical protein
MFDSTARLLSSACSADEIRMERAVVLRSVAIISNGAAAGKIDIFSTSICRKAVGSMADVEVISRRFLDGSIPELREAAARFFFDFSMPFRSLLAIIDFVA